MDFNQLQSVKHPKINEPSKYNLFRLHNSKYTLTNNESIDNVFVAISLFFLVILLKYIITRIMYMRPRFYVARDIITYFSLARIVLLDNSFWFAGSEISITL